MRDSDSVTQVRLLDRQENADEGGRAPSILTRGLLCTRYHVTQTNMHPVASPALSYIATQDAWHATRNCTHSKPTPRVTSRSFTMAGVNEVWTFGRERCLENSKSIKNLLIMIVRARVTFAPSRDLADSTATKAYLGAYECTLRQSPCCTLMNFPLVCQSSDQR